MICRPSRSHEVAYVFYESKCKSIFLRKYWQSVEQHGFTESKWPSEDDPEKPGKRRSQSFFQDVSSLLRTFSSTSSWPQKTSYRGPSDPVFSRSDWLSDFKPILKSISPRYLRVQTKVRPSQSQETSPTASRKEEKLRSEAFFGCPGSSQTLFQPFH